LFGVLTGCTDHGLRWLTVRLTSCDLIHR